MSFTQLAPTDFVVSIDSITAPAWSANQPVLSSFFTQSVGPSSTYVPSAFYLNIFQTGSSEISAATQFALAYGNLYGSGSRQYNALVNGASPTQTIYRQYRSLVYGTQLTSSNQGFNFGGTNTNATDIFIINVERNRYKESLFPGTFNLRLKVGTTTLQLTDNSNEVTTLSYLDCGRVFNIVSGSNGRSITTGAPQGGAPLGYTTAGAYGLFLPDIGTIILNPNALALPIINGGLNMTINRSSNVSTISSSINNDTLYNAVVAGQYFQLNSEETVSSNYIFARIGNADYNYTTNPTFISGSGDIIYSTLINNPQTYITTVGMYNTSNELLAVAKLSRPLVKDFTKEALIRVKLDW